MRLVLAALLALAFGVVPASAQQPTPTSRVETIARADLPAEKRQLISTNMELTEAEARAFWPIYDAYQADLQRANSRIKALIRSYADIYNSSVANEDTILKLINEKIAIDEAEAQRNKAYVPRLMLALPYPKVARYLQVEAKIRAILWYELAGNIPLVQ